MSGFRSAVSSFSASDSARPSPTASPWDTPLATPFDSPATTPGGSPNVHAHNKNKIPKAEDIHMILSDGELCRFNSLIGQKLMKMGNS